MIRITAKKDGFRRAGMAHAGTCEYPDGRFTSDELALLQAEPLLVVDVLPDGITPEPAPAPKSGKGKGEPAEPTVAPEPAA